MKNCTADERLRTSDVVSLHVPLTGETANLIGVEAIAKRKPTAILINAATGRNVDETAIVNALKAAKFGGAALDVFAEETLTAMGAGKYLRVPLRGGRRISDQLLRWIA